MPPLRDRSEDIPELALYFLRQYGERLNKQLTGIDDEAMMRLKAYAWPGNIRQLESYIQRTVIDAEKPVVTVAELPDELHADPFQLATQIYRPTSLVDENAESFRDAGDHWSPLLAPTSSASGIVPTPSGLASAIQSERIERERREREMFVRALAKANGNKAEAARALGMARSTFISRLKRLGLT